MKSIFLAIPLIFSFNIAFTQHKPIIEIYSLTIGETDTYRSGAAAIMGSSIKPNGNGYYNVGGNFIQPLNKWLSVLGGIEFSSHKIKTTYWIDNPNYPSPSPTYENIQLLSIPVNVQVDFLKYFYARAGFLIDAQTKNSTNYFNNQSGIGLNFEVGAKYAFNNHVMLFLSPFMQTHGTILFKNKSHAYKINDDGINLGIGYRF